MNEGEEFVGRKGIDMKWEGDKKWWGGQSNKN